MWALLKQDPSRQKGLDLLFNGNIFLPCETASGHLEKSTIHLIPA